MIRASKHIVNNIIDLLLLTPILLATGAVFALNNFLANSTVSSKYGWFAISIPLCLLSALLLFLKKGKQINPTAIDFLIFIFCFTGIIHSYYLFGEFTFKLSVLSLLWILYIACRIIFSVSAKACPILLFFLILTGFIEAMWGLAQLYGYTTSQHGLFKTTGSFYNPGPYGGFLALILPVALYYIIIDYKTISGKLQLTKGFTYLRWGISVLTFIVIFTVLPVTMSRASWIASIVGCLFIIGCYFREKINFPCKWYIPLQNKKYKIWILGSLLLLLIGLSLWFIYHLKKDSADGRTFIWQNTLAVIKNNPMGVGVGRFAESYGEQQICYFSENGIENKEAWIAGNPDFAFNEYLQIAAEFGVIAFILFVIIIGMVVYQGIKSKSYPAVGPLISLLVFAFFSYPFSLLPFLIIWVVLVSLCLQSDNSRFRCLNKSRIFTSILITILLPGSIYIIYPRIPIYNAYQKWRLIKMLNNKGIDEKHAFEYQAIYKYLNHESTFLFEYAQCLNRVEKYEESILILKEMQKISCDPMLHNVMGRNYQSLKRYKEAEKCFEKSALVVPGRHYPFYLLAKLYMETGETNKACEMAKYVIQKKPKVESQAIKEMQNEMKKLLEKI